MTLVNSSDHLNHSWVPEETMIYRVQQIAVPVIIAAGILGNVFSIWVLMLSPLRGLSSSFYLSALCASDTGFLVGLFIAWLPTAGTDLYNWTGWCQGITYVCHVTTFLSVWLVVAFTTERFIAVCYPLMRPTACTVGRAKAVISVLLAVSFGLYAYVPVIAGVITFSGLQMCSLRDDYESVHSVMSHVDTVVTMFVPLVVIVILNIKIIRCIRYVEKLRPQMLSVELLPKSQPSQLRVTKTLLVVSSVFILLNTPSYSIRALQYITIMAEDLNSKTAIVELNKAGKSPRDIAKSLNVNRMLVWRTLERFKETGKTLPPTLLYYTLSQTFQLLFYTNFCINFLLYCVAGQNFRAVVVAVCTQRVNTRAQYTRATSRPRAVPCATFAGSRPPLHTSLVTMSSQPKNGGSSANGVRLSVPAHPEVPVSLLTLRCPSECPCSP
ncbi:G protein-coupled receptor rhodopsin-like [Trinorchestia longiramus]|nr:G protein-coupled receptor rhodopsin-like [Trinorchestia longiramus]